MHCVDFSRGSSSSGSDTSGDEEHGQFNCPSPVMPSDDEAAHGPSQYRKQWRSKDDDTMEDCKSDEGSFDEEEAEESDGDMDDECEEEEKEEEMDEYGPALSKSEVMQRLSNLANAFSDTVKELKSSKPSRKLAHSDFEFPTSLSRKKAAPFTPPRSSRDFVSATQEDDEWDFERDSVASQSSRTPRKRLIERWQVVDVKRKSDSTKEEVLEMFADFAIDELAKAGPSDDVVAREDDLGLFRRVQVRFHAIFFVTLNGKLTISLSRPTFRDQQRGSTALNTIVRIEEGVAAWSL